MNRAPVHQRISELYLWQKKYFRQWAKGISNSFHLLFGRRASFLASVSRQQYFAIDKSIQATIGHGGCRFAPKADICDSTSNIGFAPKKSGHHIIRSLRRRSKGGWPKHSVRAFLRP